MDPKQYLVKTLTGNLAFMNMTLKDFTDADFFVRPCPGANHAAWQIGHMTSAEASVLAAMKPDAAVALPEGFTDSFKKDAAKNDEPAKFGKFATKDALLGNFEKVRQATIAFANSLSAADLDKPAPEKFKQWAPTVGELLAGQATHVVMHIGQFQVIRRKIGKPIMF